MPKFFSQQRVLFGLVAALSLVACGQKGLLYLPTLEPVLPKETPKNPDAPVQQGRITTSLVNLDTLTIAGQLAQLNPAQQKSWQALLTRPADAPERLRYVVFSGDILDKSQSLTVLSGYVKNTTIETSQQRQIIAGTYLRIRSLETGLNRVPSLMGAAETYLKKMPSVKRTNISDFLIESDDNIDLFLSVEKK
ncbi:MAG: hypothetical protein CR974_02045 [Gammaproteobacteria bacterium]|nr:MAG: hypothetical protein CR974_02045 [Gammaproteobacteria bacterium]